MKNVELARVLDKRAEKKREKGEELQFKAGPERPRKKRSAEDAEESERRKKPKPSAVDLDTVLGSIF